MIKGFADTGTRDVYDGTNSKAARKVLPRALWRVAWRKLDLLRRAASLDDLRVPPGNRLERLSGDRAGLHSIRINDRYRICFAWRDGDAHDVEIVDYH